jgi:hypothetical protein
MYTELFTFASQIQKKMTDKETPYKKITFDDVWVSHKRDRNAGSDVNAVGNRITGNDFIDSFASLLKGIGYAKPFRYAERMGITEPCLHTVVITLTDRAPREWIDEFTIRGIREILREAGQYNPLIHTSRALGFRNYETFNRFVRRHFRMTPAELRDTLHKP